MNRQPNPEQPGPSIESIRILRPADVLELIPIGRTTLWRRINSGEFPPPMKLGGPNSRAVGWLLSDLEETIQSYRKPAA